MLIPTWTNVGVAAASGPGGVSSNLLLWFQPSGISGSNGSDMTTWTDNGPFGLVPAAIGSAGNRPTVATNAINSLTAAANANHSGLQIPSSPHGVTLTSSSIWSAYMVGQVTAVQSSFMDLGSSTSVGIRFDALSGTQQFAMIASNVGNAQGEPSLGLSTYYSIVVVSTSGVLTAYFNGSAVYSLTPNRSMAAPTFPCVFDLCQGPANKLTGDLAECAFWDRAIHSTEIASIASYASTKYGLSLGSAAPMNTAFQPYLWFNPAGITGSNGADAGWTDSGLWKVPTFFLGASGNRPTVATNTLNGFTTVANNGQAGKDTASAPQGLFLSSAATATLFAIAQWTADGSGENNFCLIGASAGGMFRIGRDPTSHKIGIVIPNVGLVTGGSTIALNTWHTIVVTDNNGVLTIYLDGTSTSYGTHSSGLGAATSITLMTGGGNGNMIGNLAELAIWNGVLGSTDITALHTYASATYGI